MGSGATATYKKTPDSFGEPGISKEQSKVSAEV
jgi:hypothetical protein